MRIERTVLFTPAAARDSEIVATGCRIDVMRQVGLALSDTFTFEQMQDVAQSINWEWMDPQPPRDGERLIAYKAWVEVDA